MTIQFIAPYWPRVRAVFRLASTAVNQNQVCFKYRFHLQFPTSEFHILLFSFNITFQKLFCFINSTLCVVFDQTWAINLKVNIGYWKAVKHSTNMYAHPNRLQWAISLVSQCTIHNVFVPWSITDIITLCKYISLGPVPLNIIGSRQSFTYYTKWNMWVLNL